MDQQAKKHLQEEFDAALEEKDQMITVLQTQVKPRTRQSLRTGQTGARVQDCCIQRLCFSIAVSSICPTVASILTSSVFKTSGLIGEIILSESIVPKIFLNKFFLHVPTGCSVEKTDEGGF